MNILITGGTGFIGSALTKFFLQQNNFVTILSRQKSKLFESVRTIQSINQIDANEKIDIIINLAGSPISKKWSEAYKQTLISSRVDTTKSLITLIKSLKQQPDLLISASAIGYYGTQNSEYLDETSSYIDDFNHQLCDLWELAAQNAEELGVRTAIARLGIVLGKKEGALKKMLPLFKLGLGGEIGDGKQFFSWIHIDDVINIFNFLITNKQQKGIYNLTSPTPITNAKFTYELARILKKPAFLNIPSFAIKMIFGEMGVKLLLNGSAIYPKKLLANGYEFKFSTIESALNNIING